MAKTKTSQPAQPETDNPFAGLMGLPAQPEPLPTPDELVTIVLPPSPVLPVTMSDEPPLGWGEDLSPDPADRLLQKAVYTPAVHTPDPNLPLRDQALDQISDPQERLAAEARERRRSLLEDATRASLAKAGHRPDHLAETPSAPMAVYDGKPPATVYTTREDPEAVQRREERKGALARALKEDTPAAQWQTRVRVSAAYQFTGRAHSAPAWVDRNWIGYDDGPALLVPDVGTVRVSQWLVAQSVLNADGSSAWEELKVYDDNTFRSLYMPV